MPGFLLEVPRPCTILIFFTQSLRINYLTNTFLLVNSSVRSKQLSCFVYSRDRKTEQRHTSTTMIRWGIKKHQVQESKC